MALEELGATLTVCELAKVLRIAPNTVRKYHKQWGGVEVAPGTFRFFENIVKEKIHADTRQTFDPSLEGCCNDKWSTKGKTVQRRFQKELQGCGGLGKPATEGVREEPDDNRFGLADLS
ncbi:hypothetical protein JCM15519_37940 [Fundidesulfovibrio butyratiphilus]